MFAASTARECISLIGCYQAPTMMQHTLMFKSGVYLLLEEESCLRTRVVQNCVGYRTNELSIAYVGCFQGWESVQFES